MNDWPPRSPNSITVRWISAHILPESGRNRALSFDHARNVRHYGKPPEARNETRSGPHGMGLVTRLRSQPVSTLAKVYQFDGPSGRSAVAQQLAAQEIQFTLAELYHRIHAGGWFCEYSAIDR